MPTRSVPLLLRWAALAQENSELPAAMPADLSTLPEHTRMWLDSRDQLMAGFLSGTLPAAQEAAVVMGEVEAQPPRIPSPQEAAQIEARELAATHGNPWAKPGYNEAGELEPSTWNWTRQLQIQQADPALAAQLEAQATPVPTGPAPGTLTAADAAWVQARMAGVPETAGV